jgi:hypothetical protein
MGEARGPTQKYVDVLERAGRSAVPELSRRLGISRRAAGEAFGASAGLVLAGLARHQRRRATDPRAASAVVEKYGRRGDVGAPDIAIGAHLAKPRLDPRLGGLLGDAAGRACEWLSVRTGESRDAMGRAIAATAPMALGALSTATPGPALQSLLADVPETALDQPDRLLDPQGPCANAYQRLRRTGSPWLARVLALG